ncbi:MAG: ethanolamine ammonia-lyase light chain EutC, partial [Senegalia sp. (in: firmicutes)]
MVSEKELKKIVEQVLTELGGQSNKSDKKSLNSESKTNIEDGELPDITEVNLREQLLVPNPENKEEYLELKQNTAARVGVWRAGPRLKTSTLLRFRADHAVAMDAVFTSVDEDLIEDMDLFTVKTKCSDKDEYI